jgi:hypothetical protein
MADADRSASYQIQIARARGDVAAANAAKRAGAEDASPQFEALQERCKPISHETFSLANEMISAKSSRDRH